MTGITRQRVQKARKHTGSSIVFKYYIHDTAAGYSLEMSGPLTASSVSELDCCWQTARTTLKNRDLILDLRGLTSVDDAAKQWLASMNHEGAKYLPETFMLETVAGLPGRAAAESPRRNFFGRLSSAIRGVA
jgi:anti-anti-sigma regulatory factor